MKAVEPLPKAEGQLSDEELISKQDEIAAALMELDHIESAAVSLYYRPENAEELCFQATLSVEDLKDHVDEVTDTIVSMLGSCDLEHSRILDTMGNIMDPA